MKYFLKTSIFIWKSITIYKFIRKNWLCFSPSSCLHFHISFFLLLFDLFGFLIASVFFLLIFTILFSFSWIFLFGILSIKWKCYARRIQRFHLLPASSVSVASGKPTFSCGHSMSVIVIVPEILSFYFLWQYFLSRFFRFTSPLFFVLLSSRLFGYANSFRIFNVYIYLYSLIWVNGK